MARRPRSPGRRLENLGEFLEDFPQEAVSALAIRSAMRVVPVLAGSNPVANLAIIRSVFPLLYAGNGNWGQPSKWSPSDLHGKLYASRNKTHVLSALAHAQIASTLPQTYTSQVANLKWTIDHSRGAAMWNAEFKPNRNYGQSRDSITRAVQADCRWIHSNKNQIELLSRQPLWIIKDGIPSWATDAILSSTSELKALGSDWSTFDQWYNSILIQPEALIEFKDELSQIAAEPPEFWGDSEENARTSDLVMTEIAFRLGWLGAPRVPEDRSGIQFETTTGKYAIASSGLGDEDDIAEIEGLRDVILEALEDLAASCQGTNAFTRVSRVSDSYRKTLEGEITRVSIDKLYAYGVRMSNANSKLLSDIESGVLPEPGGEIAEALDSVLTLHGPMILGTKRGQELLKRSREYLLTQEKELEYKERLKAFTDAVGASDLVDRDSMDVLDEVTEAFGTGDHPERSNEVAVTASRNLLGAMGRETLVKTAGLVVGTGIALSASGQAAIGEVSALTDATITFLQANESTLRSLAAVGGTDFSWVSSLLNWINRRKS